MFEFFGEYIKNFDISFNVADGYCAIFDRFSDGIVANRDVSKTFSGSGRIPADIYTVIVTYVDGGVVRNYDMFDIHVVNYMFKA